MKRFTLSEQHTSRLFRWFALLLVFTGVVLRIITWNLGRNLVIDEANVARNIAECNFAQLTQPLKYEQYAPPVFLWMEKLATLLFGFGERSLWLYPLLCGIGATYVLYKIARQVMPDSGVWLTTGLFALGFFYVAYSCTLKQYMPDAFVGLLLILVALKTPLTGEKRLRFTGIWALAGSLAIWSSMPSVFVLAGIGAYYSWSLLKERKWSVFVALLPIFALWLVQFICYYLAILQPQAESDYLQNYHRDFFLHLLPASAAEWEHNITRLYEIVGYMGGWTVVAMGLNLLLLFTGFILLARKHVAQFLLLIIPVIAVLFAAAFHKFSLIERVIMFLYPLLLLFVGYGFAQLWRVKYVAVKVVLLLAGMITLFGNAHFSHYVHYKDQTFQIREGLDYLSAKKVRGNQLYVPGPSVATYVYYTTIHPQHQQYNTITGAHLLSWSDDFSAITHNLQDTTWFIFSEDFKETERNRRLGEIEQQMKPFDHFEQHNAFVFGYLPKPAP